ncbi:MAG: hypothetical protein HUU37_09955, partial [Bdellovibrionales bacterium]|nr:hypothetical protein [Bdellovibrionales bacterium]
MSRLRIPVAISALLLTVSCGRLADSFRPLNAPATTEVKILPPRIAGLSAQATLLGGIMVYAVNNQEHFRRGGRKMPDEMAPLTWMIPTAEYVFYAVGWQAPNLSSGSQMMCGKTSGPVRLNGEPTTIQLIMSAAFCGEHPFSAAGWNSGTQPQPFYVAMCASGDDPPISSSCSGS